MVTLVRVSATGESSGLAWSHFKITTDRALPVNRIRTRRPHCALLALGFACAQAGCGTDLGMPTAEALGVAQVEARIPACPVPSADSSPLRVDTLATGLEVPWGVTFLPDGRALVTERPGRIRVLTPEGVLLPDPWAEVEVYSEPGYEIGLLGIDVRPGSAPAEVYVAATLRHVADNPFARVAGGLARRLARAVDSERGHAVTLEVLRLVDVDGRGVDPRPIVSGLPAAPIHGGGSVRFGPDGALYVSNGDAAEPARAQDPASTRGKILRYAADGSVPADNPVPGSPVFASGVRHVQGLDWLPGPGDLLATDHGPTGLPAEGFRTDQDELSAVAPGANLGWPIVTGATSGGTFTSSIAVWSPALAPGGLVVYRGESPTWQGSVFVTGLRGASLRRLELERAGSTTAVACEEVLLAGTHGRLRLARSAPDGSLWIGTSNRDGRGTPRGSDDLLLRLRPPEP
jgi:glucose/arabinose dehydrogenase